MGNLVSLWTYLQSAFSIEFSGKMQHIHAPGFKFALDNRRCVHVFEIFNNIFRLFVKVILLRFWLDFGAEIKGRILNEDNFGHSLLEEIAELRIQALVLPKHCGWIHFPQTDGQPINHDKS
jgi:hypothetical protein